MSCRVRQGRWVSSPHNPPAFWLLFLFDIATVVIEGLHSFSLYFVYVTSAASCKLFADPSEVVYVAHVIFDIILQLVTLAHFSYVCFMNGLTLSLIDVLLFLNIRSTGMQLLKRFGELRALWITRNNLDVLFPTVSLVQYRYLASVMYCNYTSLLLLLFYL